MSELEVSTCNNDSLSKTNAWSGIADLNTNEAGKTEKVTTGQDNPVLKELSRLNSQVNRMSKNEMRERLVKVGLQPSGSKEVLQKRLKSYYRQAKLGPKAAEAMAASNAGKNYDYLCVIDFEATCDDHVPPDYVHEIIEFPAVLLCTHNRKLVKEFHQYCRPLRNPQLTEFCTSLTGITQEQVDEANDFPTVLADFEAWLSEMQLGTKYRFAIVTDGPYDMGRFLFGQCKLSGIPFPKFGKTWINVRKSFSNFYDSPRISLAKMLDNLGLDFEGRQHSGLDDSKNIARITIQLLKDGATLRINEQLQLDSNGDRIIHPISKTEFHNNHRSRKVQTSQHGKNNFMDRNVPSRAATGDNSDSSRQKTKRLTVSVLTVEEQLSNLGIDPAMEDSLEQHYSQKLLNKFARNK